MMRTNLGSDETLRVRDFSQLLTRMTSTRIATAAMRMLDRGISDMAGRENAGGRLER